MIFNNTENLFRSNASHTTDRTFLTCFQPLCSTDSQTIFWKLAAFGNYCQEPPLREKAKFICSVQPVRKSESPQCSRGGNHCFWDCLVHIKTNDHRKQLPAHKACGQSLNMSSNTLHNCLPAKQTSFLSVLHCNYIACTDY